ncbi:MAG: hypothetical protein JJU00_00080 [Opitutales bacterium]|nr:hypothetical protein [Opitutales bacterium]
MKLPKSSTPAARLVTGALCLALSLGATAHANIVHDDDNLLAYEGFDYDVGGSLTFGNLEGGFGWAAPWRVTSAGSQGLSAPIQEGTLEYTDAEGNRLVTSGNHAYGSGAIRGDFASSSLNIARELADPLGSEPGSVYYISFLAQRVGPELDPEDPVFEGDYPYGDNLYPRNAGIRLMGPPDTGQFGGNALDALIGTPSYFGDGSAAPTNDWKFNSEVTSIRTGVLMHEQTSLVVARIERNVVEGEITDDEGNPATATGDRVTFWVNPSLEAEIDEDGLTEDILRGNGLPFHIPVGRIGVEAGDADFPDDGRPEAHIIFDEIRVGTTYASVTPYTTDGEVTWYGYTVVDGWADTGDWMGQLYVGHDPWVYNPAVGWTYVADVHETGAWMFVPIP